MNCVRGRPRIYGMAMFYWIDSLRWILFSLVCFVLHSHVCTVAVLAQTLCKFVCLISLLYVPSQDCKG